MKKCIFLFVILNICAISTLHSQWLEKEGYWELSEKIPDLRDLKILPEDNLIITVSKDNTIRHIEYDSGKILKSGKPAGLPDSNDYAKISSDGKTTVVARYVKNVDKEKHTDCFMDIVKNNSFEIQYHLQLLPNNTIPKLEKKERLYSHKIELSNSDYDNENNMFFINAKTDYVIESGSVSQIKSGYSSVYKIEDVNINKIWENFDYEIVHFDNFLNFKNNNYYIGKRDIDFISLDQSTKSLVKFISLFEQKSYDTLIELINYYSVNKTYKGMPLESSGYVQDFKQVFIKNKDDLILRTNGKIYNYDILSGIFKDSIENNVFINNIYFSRNLKYFHTLQNRYYAIYNYSNVERLFFFPFPYESDLQIHEPKIDETNSKVIFSLDNNSILLLDLSVVTSVGDSPIIFTDKLTHSAYPNPTNEVLNLKVAVSESTNYTIKLYDIFGTEILNIHDGFIPANTEKIFSIPTSALSIGSYYYMISGGGLVDRGKVMVVR